MSLFAKSLDLDLASAGIRRGPFAFLARVRSLLRALRNRDEILELGTFTDAQLADIGLTRGDIRAALSGSPFDDPSGVLTARAAYRRPVIRRR